MSSLLVIPPKTSGETNQVLFDFLSQLVNGDTVSSATATATTWSGTDTNPSAVISGTPSVTAPSQVYVRLTGGVAGNIYLITVTASTANSNAPVIQSYLAVNDIPL